MTPSSIVLIASTIKGKTKEGAIPLHPLLSEELDAWKLVANPTNPVQWVFPGRNVAEHLTGHGFEHTLRKAVEKHGLQETSTQALEEAY